MDLLSNADLDAQGLYTREHRRRLTRAGLFPRPLKLGDGGPRARSAWIKAEIDAWLEQRAAARPSPPPAAETAPKEPPRGRSMAKPDDRRDRPREKPGKREK